ncbi:MAG: glycoside hydrolase family 3 N-terminal domain-containing protein [Lutibacter sp.]|jgi:beta-glucosidase-like glycosyl hydrolase/CubicO group peptidase (beta-lactamase class C family)
MIKRIVFLILLLNVAFLKAQNLDPLQTKDVAVQAKWVDSLMKNMTIDEKIGQLFMVQAYSNKDEKHRIFIDSLIKNYHIGGLIFMQGTPEKQAVLTNSYQSISKIPLLIGFDGEWGLDMRLKDTYRFPWNMALGAISDNKLLEDFGSQLGKQCKRLGIHINFAPVVDININPENPIIGNRSFGENRDNVTQKALAFVKGMQSQHVLSNAKHFPGHGDTAADSHKSLPILDFDFSRLDSIELYPYKSLINNRLTSIMVGHLSVEGLEPNKDCPASLSYQVISKLLKEKLNFKGLILTDALNMKGVSTYSQLGDINLEALLAGNDMLLIPNDVPLAIDTIKVALSENRITEERINYSVRKILKAKYWAGLNAYKKIELANLQQDLNAVEAVLLHRKLVENSITLLKNEDLIFPIQHLEKKKIAYVKLGDANHTDFLNMLKNYAEVDEVSNDTLDNLIAQLKPYNLVIVGFHKSNDNPWKDYRFNDKELAWLKEIAKKNMVILDIFASPYSLLQLENLKNIEGVLVSFQNSKIAQEISAQMLFGALEIKGKLPVSISGEFAVNEGLTSNSLGLLGYSIPEDVGLSSEKLSKIDSVAAIVLNGKMAPGMQILVARRGKVVYQKSFGFHTDEQVNPVLNSDLYDIASVTKIVATLPLLMELEEHKVFHINSTLGSLIHKLRKTNKDKITVKEVLSHYGRLKPDIPFYLQTLNSGTKMPSADFYRREKSDKFNIKVADSLYLLSTYSDSIFDIIAHTHLLKKKEYKYSDLGYFIFKEYIENYYKADLNELTQQHFYEPLGANRTTYNPLEKFSKNEIVPTEKDNYYRFQLLQGYVHDMGAAMQGGVGGHAGIFSNANDIAKIMQMYLQKGYYGGRRYFKPETIDLFNHRYYASEGVRKGLGFDKPQLKESVMATCGCVSDESFGHSGFTGTYTWADTESEIVYVFLSNRVFPTSSNMELVKNNIRTEIQQLIQDAIIK